MKAKVKHLVVDSSGFIKCADLFCLAESFYTVNDVLMEIKDGKTKARLRALPFELTVLEPDSSSLKFVTEFSKKTGDYATLSKADLNLLAAVHALAVKHLGSCSINEEPLKADKANISPGHPENGMPGFYTPGKTNVLNDPEKSSVSELGERLKFLGDWNDEAHISNPEDEEGWITPASIAVSKDDSVQPKEAFTVACLTSDFAVQNTLTQMGLNVLSIDGRSIEHTKKFVLRCFSCFQLSTNATKKFCPNCGNDTLTKLTVSYDSNGAIVYHFSKRKVITPKGSKFSLPAPKGGKHAKNPILFEDQPMSHNKLSRKSLQKMDVFDPDYVAGDSPFAMHDITSRSAVLGLRSLQRRNLRNPNDYTRTKKRGGKKR
ncbi:RNA binding protein NOB1 [Trichuris trichiura]|uniref:RNA-binding protein NOB1 n=1 Tax=Trichuris trichiura TaxID=36087 RepID=A0A077ZIM3_TRITR|nr:RNA binding protein NOB1 [Trichuris trichiura]